MALTVGELVAYAQIDLKDFDRGLSGIERGLRAVQGSATSATGKMERDISHSFDRMLRDIQGTLGDVERQSGKSGQASGNAFSKSLDSALDAVDKVAGRAGRDAGSSFIEEAREMLRYGELEFEVDADIAAALAAVQRVEDALDGLDDQRVRVDVDTSSALDSARQLVDVAGGLGSKFSDALSVIGRAGPANVAIAGGAIAALPAVAGLAAAGIVTALGGALTTVGFTAAAQSDRVKHAWSEAVSAIEADLADAAEPFEDSAIRAAEVAQRSFERLKPTLSRIFKDLAPDVDRFIDAVGDGVVRLGPGLDRIGDSFGKLLSGLSDQMPSIMDNLNAAFTTFSDIMDENPEMLGNLIKDATELLKVGADVLVWADEIQAALTLPVSPTGANNVFWEHMFGQSYDEFMEQAGTLPSTLSKMHQSAAEGAAAIRNMGGEAGTTAAAVRSLSDALEEHFNPAQKALDAEIRLKQALQEASKAAKDDKMSAIDRLRSVQDMTRAIADAAKAESERTGKTTEAGNAFMAQLPTLLDWAGKNRAARDTVLGLADSLGVTIGKTKDGTVAVDALGRAIQILPNGKTTEIKANTAEGKRQLDEFLLYIARQKGTVDVHVRTIYDNPSGRKALEQKARAAGGIERYAAGGLRAFAAGGRTSPAPHIASSPTILYGEGSAPEAFIPYESRFRSRAIDLLSEVASDFGLGVFSPSAAQLMADMAAKSLSGIIADIVGKIRVGRGSLPNIAGVSAAAGSLAGSMPGASAAGVGRGTPINGTVAFGGGVDYKNPPQSTAAPAGNTIIIPNAVVREESDIFKLGDRVAFELAVL
jgi:hypothetical protein